MEAVTTLAQDVITRAQARNLSLVTAESCTGGALSTLFTDIPGAGEVFCGGFVCYAKECKERLLGVAREVLDKETAVSQAVAEAMARGALERSGCDLAVAVTGVAGPMPDEDGNPVGLVHIASAASFGEVRHRSCQLSDQSTGHVRGEALRMALELLLETLAELPQESTAKRAAKV